MPAPKTEKEIRGFLGRLQYISRFIARLTDICEPIFRLLRKNQPTVWNDDCQFAFEKIKEYLLSPPVLVPPTPGRPLLLYLSVSDMALGSLVWATRRLRHYMTEYSVHLISRLDPLRYLFDRPALTGRLMRWLVLLTEFDIQYVSQKSIKGSIVADHLASLPTSEDRPVDDDFPDEEFVAMTSLSGWCMYFDGAANQSGYGIGVLLVSPQVIIFRETALELDIRQMEVFGDSNLTEVQDDLPWYHDIYQFLRSGTYPEVATAKDRRALRNLATRFVICGDTLYRRSADGMLLLCLDRASADRVMREVHSGVCGPHMGGHMLASVRFMVISYTAIRVTRLTSPWPFSVWGIDIIGKVSPKSSSGHEFILVAIDYFTKWVEAASYARLTSARVAKYGIRHHRSSAYRPQTNGAVEAANKNIKRILRKMVETSRDWSEKLPFALWAYRTSFRTSTGATPYSLVYGMEAVFASRDRDGLIESLSEKDGSCLQETVKPRPLQKGDLVLRILRGLIGDPRGKFRPSWSGPYVIRELTPEGAAWLTDLDGNQFSEPTNVDS
ncbi:Retrovirus-related Pol polyprotein from transposon 17.6 [Vitis vinifera]|uniref:Retrovirus-related Pol polyprotein from transposon 17.6 n=1 Tax=Vitis vinifera TaxID=29760 RepID=A0A438DDS3_VITVI|nr:Retrovirus-related Pol polyprotein from transposon 17.6 [Vitis vinifera]